MFYNSTIHPRRSIGLKGYDHAQARIYFITISCYHNRHVFGTIRKGQMILNDFGRIADDEWQDLTIRFMHIELDAYVVMPNHMHGIIFINSITPEVKNLATNTAVLNQITGKTENTGAQVACVNRASTIGNMISAYKSLVVNKCLDKFKIIYPDQLMGNIWHSGYYENIIRNEQAYANISNYIRENPANWKGDKFFRDDD